jgi:hypothetical protein
MMTSLPGNAWWRSSLGVLRDIPRGESGAYVYSCVAWEVSAVAGVPVVMQSPMSFWCRLGRGSGPCPCTAHTTLRASPCILRV